MSIYKDGQKKAECWSIATAVSCWNFNEGVVGCLSIIHKGWTEKRAEHWRIAIVALSLARSTKKQNTNTGESRYRRNENAERDGVSPMFCITIKLRCYGIDDVRHGAVAATRWASSVCFSLPHDSSMV